jgi:REP element-mobilizing transposase RayT
MPKYDANRDHRGSIRLAGHDYTRPGAYFVTFRVAGTDLSLGEVNDGHAVLNEYGRAVVDAWNVLPEHYPRVALDAFVVMPNHVHGLIVLKQREATNVGAGLRPAPSAKSQRSLGLSEVVRALKSFSARRINELREAPGASVWQRNYYERVIRGEAELQRVRRYVSDNPANWRDDEFYPE